MEIFVGKGARISNLINPVDTCCTDNCEYCEARV